jgi:hypothetical protein
MTITKVSEATKAALRKDAAVYRQAAAAAAPKDRKVVPVLINVLEGTGYVAAITGGVAAGWNINNALNELGVNGGISAGIGVAASVLTGTLAATGVYVGCDAIRTKANVDKPGLADFVLAPLADYHGYGKDDDDVIFDDIDDIDDFFRKDDTNDGFENFNPVNSGPITEVYPVQNGAPA